MDWDKYIQVQQENRAQAAKDLQEVIRASGVPMEQIMALSRIDLDQVDPKIIQELELSMGAKLTDFVAQTPAKNASNWRQRTKALAV